MDIKRILRKKTFLLFAASLIGLLVLLCASLFLINVYIVKVTEEKIFTSIDELPESQAVLIFGGAGVFEWPFEPIFARSSRSSTFSI